jgi:hypothetical protein
MSSQVYFEGSFWYAKTATGAGESPDTAQEKWQELRIPSELRAAIALRAAAGLQEFARPDVAMALRNNADTELLKQKNQAALRDGQSNPMPVKARD